MALQIAGDAGAGDTPDLGGDLLDDDHQREAEHEGPGEPVAELGADLAVGADSARIVVGGAGDEAGAEARKNGPGPPFPVSRCFPGAIPANMAAKPCRSNCR